MEPLARGHTEGVLPQLAPDVVKRAQRGDERAYGAIVDAYRLPVFNYVLRTVADRELAEDLTQEVFLRVWRSLPSFGHRAQLSTWLFQVAKNVVLDAVRARDSRPRTTELVPEAPFFAAEAYHQDYYRQHKKAAYCLMNIVPKLKKLEKFEKSNAK